VREKWRKVVVESLGAKCTDGITLETTHLVILASQPNRHVSSTIGDDLMAQASTMNIPIVSSFWLDACRDEGKLMPVAEYFVKKAT
jgi:hypothetical protein